MTLETLDEKIARVLKERIAIAEYDPNWPERFRREREHLLACLPVDLVRRIEHFGSTSIPGMCAKPIVDILVEVTSLEETRVRIAPILEEQGYDYFWRPTLGDDPPFYAWFIKRNDAGERTHHIHMVEAGFPQWEGIAFRDFLRNVPEARARYARLKRRLADVHGDDRVAYTLGKGTFIREIIATAKRAAGAKGPGEGG